MTVPDTNSLKERFIWVSVSGQAKQWLEGLGPVVQEC